jgi:hypothetical protein
VTDKSARAALVAHSVDTEVRLMKATRPALGTEIEPKAIGHHSDVLNQTTCRFDDARNRRIVKQANRWTVDVRLLLHVLSEFNPNRILHIILEDDTNDAGEAVAACVTLNDIDDRFAQAAKILLANIMRDTYAQGLASRKSLEFN